MRVQYSIYIMYMRTLTNYVTHFIGWIDLARVRIPGVLQRFAIVYWVVASTAAIAAKMQGTPEEKVRSMHD